MKNPDPADFAAKWCEAWNAHDLDRVLAHFHDDVLFTSPVAASLLPETRGVVRGKAALRAYWEEGLRRIPDLHFSIEAVFAGIDTLVIQYRNQKGVSVSEVLIFDAGSVREGHGTYMAT
ncbi:MAG: nuclear transport factor 2 family protein [Sphingopyxis sp.]|nr:nuclear transport factor 2 family protein [Sphingopyxis sp.]